MLLIFLISSCQREFDLDTPPTPPIVNTGDSVYLSEYFAINSSNPVDTIQKTVFHYDSQKRFIESESQGYFTDPIRITNFPFFERQKWFYTGNDTLPYMVVKDKGSFRDTCFLYYNSAGIIIQDSLLEYTGNDFKFGKVVKYSPDGTGSYVIMINKRNAIGDLSYETIWSTRNVVSGNFVNGYDSTIYPKIAPFPDEIQTIRYTGIYDAHPNPFYRMYLRYPVATEGLGNIPNDYFFNMGVNNLVSYQINSVWAGLHVTILKQFIYTYNSIGLPNKVSLTQDNNPASTFGVYVYTAL